MLVAKETVPLPSPPPPQLNLSLSTLDFPGIEREDKLEVDREGYMELLNFGFDHGQNSLFQYSQCTVTQCGRGGRGRIKYVTSVCSMWCVIPENADCQNCPSVAAAWAYSWLKPEPRLVSIPAKPSQAKLHISRLSPSWLILAE